MRSLIGTTAMWKSREGPGIASWFKIPDPGAGARSSQPNPEPKLVGFPQTRRPATVNAMIAHQKWPAAAWARSAAIQVPASESVTTPLPAPARRHAPVSNPRLPPGNRTGRPPLAPRQSAASRLHGTGAGTPGPSVRAGRPSRSKRTGSSVPGSRDSVVYGRGAAGEAGSRRLSLGEREWRGGLRSMNEPDRPRARLVQGVRLTPDLLLEPLDLPRP